MKAQMAGFSSKNCLQADVVYHLLTHMDLRGNPSNLFDGLYIEKMRKIRLPETLALLNKMGSLQDYYEQNFARLAVINFFPFYTSGIDDFIAALCNYRGFTEEDMGQFVNEFLNIFTTEAEQFYGQFWQYVLESNRQNLADFNAYLGESLSHLECIFRNTGLQPNVYACVSMRRYGRGFTKDGFLSAAVPLPSGPEQYGNAFFQAVHEFTHQLTDELINLPISMADQSHALSESVVIVGDYYLFQRLDASKIEAYLGWVSDLSGAKMGPTAPGLLRQFRLPEDLHLSLRNLVEDLCR